MSPATPAEQWSDAELQALVKRHGATSKLVRAICAVRNWRWTPQGAPPEWYNAYRGPLGKQLEEAFSEGRHFQKGTPIDEH